VEFPILSLLLIVPLVGTVLTVISGKRNAKWVALVFALIALVLSAVLMLHFLPDSLVAFNYDSTGRFFAYEWVEWAPSLGLNYIVGVDGLSAPLVFLTQLLVLIGLIFSWKKEERPHQFFGLILLIGLAITGVFISLDLFLFFIFWELVLIPMYFFIAIWGGPNRHYASIKFLVYTHVGSVVMLLGIFALYLSSGDFTQDGARTFNLVEYLVAADNAVRLGSVYLTMSLQVPLFIAFFFGFGVKMPMVPFHTWLPDAHVEAPTAGSVILAGLLLKMGGYGIFRLLLGILPEATKELWWLLAIFGIVSIVYAAFVCLAQTDLKRLIAYSSISHMGFVLLGAATMTTAGIAGGIFQMFNHGLITAVLFMLAGSIKHAAGTREIPKLSGLAKVMPKFSLILIIGFFASMGMPGLNGFVSEFLVFLGTYAKLNSIEMGKLIIIPLLGVIVTAAYYLWTLHRMTLGDLKESLKNVLDIPRHEVLPLAVLTFLIILFGLYPTPVLGVIWPHAQGLTGLLGGP
jgi:NADH-quinone oxidoreductase subunit M